jgi:hypothetical protein
VPELIEIVFGTLADLVAEADAQPDADIGSVTTNPMTAARRDDPPLSFPVQ